MIWSIPCRRTLAVSVVCRTAARLSWSNVFISACKCRWWSNHIVLDWLGYGSEHSKGEHQDPTIPTFGNERCDYSERKEGRKEHGPPPSRKSPVPTLTVSLKSYPHQSKVLLPIRRRCYSCFVHSQSPPPLSFMMFPRARNETKKMTKTSSTYHISIPT